MNKKEQRVIYLETIANTLRVHNFNPKDQPKYLDQIAGGVKLFRSKWSSCFLLRLCFNIVLPFVMLGYNVVVVCKYSFISLFHKKRKFCYDKLFVSEHHKLYSVGKYAGLVNSDSVWFSTPLDVYKIPEPHISLTVFDYLSFTDVWVCLFQSIVCRIISIYKFGYKTYFLNFKAFSWLVTDTALRKTPKDVELLFSNNIDRIAILIDNLPHKKKSLVQHGCLHFYHSPSGDERFSYNKEYGFWTWNCIFKFKSLTRMYCYSEKDKQAYQISNMSCTPEYIIIGTPFKPSFKPDGKSILIVADPSIYLKEEEYIIKSMQSYDVRIYLKNHPAQSDKYYDTLREKYQFIFLPGSTKELPDVDIVISYDSTLAYDYEANGTKVLYYYNIELEKINIILENELKLN